MIDDWRIYSKTALRRMLLVFSDYKSLLVLRSERSEGQIQYRLKSRGGLQRREPGPIETLWSKLLRWQQISSSPMDRLAIHVLINVFKMFHWRLGCAYTEGDSSRKPRHDRRCHFEFAIEVRFNHVISLIHRDISQSGNGNSQVGNLQALYVGFLQLMYFYCGVFDVKWAEKHLHVIKFHNIYIFSIFLTSLAATSFVTCFPLFPRIESAVPTLKDIRAAVARASWQRARATWLPDQWLDRESVHPDVQLSKKHAVNLVD